MRLRVDNLVKELNKILEKYPNAQVMIMYEDTYKGSMTESADQTIYLDKGYAIPQVVICTQ